jgi:hypothetical protein
VSSSDICSSTKTDADYYNEAGIDADWHRSRSGTYTICRLKKKNSGVPVGSVSRRHRNAYKQIIAMRA